MGYKSFKLLFQKLLYFLLEPFRSGLGQCSLAGDCLALPVDQNLMEIPAGDTGDETQFLPHPLVEGMSVLALDH